jgi:hypothetical protein
MTLEKSFDDIKEPDLLSLVEDKVSEKRDIEYKRELPTNSHHDKKEFLADISSFANASGGHIIFGVPEKNGLPIDIAGVSCDDPDGEILRLQNLIIGGIEPRLQGVLIKEIPLQSGAFAFIIRIPQSWSKPHVVNFENHWKFYSRTSAGKSQLDVSEVRLAFIQSGTLTEKIRLFRDGRLGSILAEQTPTPLIPGARIVVHLIPYVAFEPAVSFPLGEIAKNPWPIKPLYGSVTNYRYNFDGFLIANGIDEKGSRGYVQIFRNGIIEAVDSSILRKQGDKAYIPSQLFEQELIEGVRVYLDTQKQMTVSPPISLMVSLLGVSGYIMAVNNIINPWHDHEHPIDRDTLVLPEIIFESFPSGIARALRLIFDTVWNATGWPKSHSYDDQGEWGKGPNYR